MFLNNFSTDLVVAVGNNLNVLSSTKSKWERISLGPYNTTIIVALVQDPVSGRLFFSDKYNHHASILSIGLDQTASNISLPMTYILKSKFIFSLKSYHI